MSGILTADWKKKNSEAQFWQNAKSQHFDLYLMFGKIVRSNKARFPVISFNDSKSDCEFCVFLFFLQSLIFFSHIRQIC